MKLTNISISRDIRDAMDDIPSIAPIIGQIHTMFQETDISPKDLIHIIMLDPVLTGKVLDLVNSSFYGRPERITSLGQALIILGFNAVKNLAISSALLNTISFKGRRSPINPEEFWRHCLATAVGSKYLAKCRDIPHTELEKYFFAGLFHDIGKILLIRTNPDMYRKAVYESQRLGLSLEFAEYAHFGCAHTQAGGLLARKWKLDPYLIDVIEQHHSFSPDTPNPIDNLIALSNNICKKAAIGQSGNGIIEEIADDIQRYYHVEQDDLTVFSDRLPSVIEKAVHLLNVAPDRSEL